MCIDMRKDMYGVMGLDTGTEMCTEVCMDICRKTVRGDCLTSVVFEDILGLYNYGLTLVMCLKISSAYIVTALPR